MTIDWSTLSKLQFGIFSKILSRYLKVGSIYLHIVKVLASYKNDFCLHMHVIIFNELFCSIRFCQFQVISILVSMLKSHLLSFVHIKLRFSSFLLCRLFCSLFHAIMLQGENFFRHTYNLSHITHLSRR